MKKNEKIEEPYFSIVIPTRDRPEFVAICLKYLANQSFHNFEVILSDNFVNASCKKQFDSFSNDERFYYVKPEKPLSMSEHWNFAISHAKGQYISIVSEKHILRPDALQILFDTLIKSSVDIVTWWHETLSITGDKRNTYQGMYIPFNKPRKSAMLSSSDELKRCFSFEQKPYSRQLGANECLGKIYSGCYSRSLISKIIEQYGSVFNAISPDVSSKIAALSLSEYCLDIGEPLMLVCASPESSNGYQCSISTRSIKEYFKSIGGLEYFANSLPLKKLWIGLCNYIAYDYLSIQKKTNNQNFKKVSLNKVNLLAWSKKDLLNIQVWESEKEKIDTFDTWQSLFNACTINEQETVEYLFASNIELRPSNYEISNSGIKHIGTIERNVSAQERAELNWNHNQLFNVPDEYSHYDTFDDAMDYFTQYYQESAKLLKLGNEE